MELKIQKTTEETITIDGLPKYYKSQRYLKFIKLTEEGIIGVGDEIIYNNPKSDSKYFTQHVIDVLDYEEITEKEFYDYLQIALTKFKNI